MKGAISEFGGEGGCFGFYGFWLRFLLFEAIYDDRKSCLNIKFTLYGDH